MKFTEQSQTKTKEKSQVVEAVEVSSKVKENAKVAKVDSKLMYRNEMNNISFPKFTAMDFNIFFIILYYVSKCIKKNGGIIEMIRKSDNETDEFIEVKFDVLRMFLPQVKNKKRFFNEIVKFVLYKLKYLMRIMNHSHLKNEDFLIKSNNLN